jgi:hypothetical protein
VSATYTVTDADGRVSAPAPITVDVAPVSADVTAATALDAHGAASVTLRAPTPTGSGPFGYELATRPAADAATATIDAGTGRMVVTAKRGVSGPVSFSYRARDVDGVRGAPRFALVVVAPYVGALTATTDADTSVTLDPPAVQGTAPLRYRLATKPRHGSARIDAKTGVIRYTPSSGWSGVARFELAATDAAGISSAPAPVTVAVRPKAQTVTTPPTGGTGGKKPGPVTVDLPAPKGTGPFTYEIVTGPKPDEGTTRLDPRTGELVFTPKKGFSGRVMVTYRVTDADGVVSEKSRVAFEIRPVAEAVSGRTTGTSEAHLSPQPPTGTGPFTYRLTERPSAAEGRVTIDPLTGEMVFVPAPGHTGPVHFSYSVVDADGVESLPVDVTVDVAAAAVPKDFTLPSALARTGGNVGGLVLLAALLIGAGVTVRRVGSRRM